MTVREQFNEAIVILGVHGETLEGAVELPDKAAKAFVSFVKSTLKQLAETRTGNDLIRRISATRKSLTIFAADPTKEKKDNAAMKSPPTIACDLDCMVVPFRPRHRNVPLKQKLIEGATDAKGGKVHQEAYLDYKREMRSHSQALHTRDAGGELGIVLNRARSNGYPVDALPARTGLSPAALAAMSRGEKRIDTNTYYSLVFHLNDFLTPGPGADTTVRLMTEAAFKQDFAAAHEEEHEPGIFASKAATWKKIAAAIVGHELIHAWRMMCGRRVVTQGWEEEAMTTGVGPFRSWTVTENNIRLQLNLSPRETYQSGSCSSDVMNGVMMNMNWGGTVDFEYTW